MGKYIVELDKIKTKIPKSICTFHTELDTYGNYMGFQYALSDDYINISLSGKLMATSMELGAITLDNFQNCVKNIFSISGIELPTYYLLEQAPIFVVHVKQDILVDDIPSYYISELREICKANTDNYDVYKYVDLTYENGFRLIPNSSKHIESNEDCGIVLTPKTLKNYRYNVYLKGVELRKFENKEYRKIFDEEFLSQADNIIRFELQLRTYEDLRHAFNLSNRPPTLIDILSSQNNPVKNFFEQEIIKCKGE